VLGQGGAQGSLVFDEDHGDRGLTKRSGAAHAVWQRTEPREALVGRDP
jgi:hypothetical protein